MVRRTDWNTSKTHETTLNSSFYLSFSNLYGLDLQTPYLTDFIQEEV